MRIGYARVSKADGSQVLDLQRDALIQAGVTRRRIYCDRASVGARTARTWPRASRRCGGVMC